MKPQEVKLKAQTAWGFCKGGALLSTKWPFVRVVLGYCVFCGLASGTGAGPTGPVLPRASVSALMPGETAPPPEELPDDPVPPEEELLSLLPLWEEERLPDDESLSAAAGVSRPWDFFVLPGRLESELSRFGARPME